ncbi:PAS domain-containing protein [Xanthobacter sp. AM11]|uniref:PAS domain-containing protein n=1 Tax=Xanthobacter sp. AM11 TaxID=3380643 RepID=UPI0039BF9FA1
MKRPLAWRLAFAAAVLVAAVALSHVLARVAGGSAHASMIFRVPAVVLITLACGPAIGLAGLAALAAASAILAPAIGSEPGVADPGGARAAVLSVLIDGAVAWAVCAVLSIAWRRQDTARERMVAALDEQQTVVATLEALLDHAPVGFAFFDRRMRFVRVNGTLARMVGIPAAEHPGRSLADMLPQLAEAVSPGLAQVLATGTVIADVEVEGATPALPGAWRHFLVSYFPVRTHGDAIGLAGMILVEITERKKAEKSVAASEQRYRLLAEALPKMVWTSTCDGTGDYYNRRWSEFTGVRPEGGKTLEWHTFLHPDDQRPAVDAWRACLASGAPFSRECRLRAADGGFRWFLCRAVPVRDDDGRIDRWYGSCTDISEIVAAREMLAHSNEHLERLAVERTAELARANSLLKQEMEDRLRAEAQLRQAQKMEAVGQLTGGIAHDFNNLLTIIIGNLEAAERRVAPEATEIRRFLDYGRQGALRAATLTQRLLAFSRRQPLDPRPTDVNRLVSAMSHMLASALGERVTVETVLAGGLWHTEIDHNQLENAILNLAVNARDAMPGGGKVTIETANAYLDAAYCASHDDLEPGQYVALIVSDTGTGMSEEVRARAFEPFFTTKGPRDGTGLGLSQVYGFVRQSGGHVIIHSKRDQGTTVKLYLPRLDDPSTVEASAPGIERGGRDGRARVLLVDEDADLRALGAAILREAGHEVLEAGDALSALAMLDTGAAPDLLLTDIILGTGMDGLALAEEVKRRRTNIRVLFTTAYAKNAAVRPGWLDARARLLAKPFSQMELVEKVKDILEEPASRGTVLLVEDEPFVALVARQILEDHGFDVTVASHGAAALAHARAAFAQRGPAALALAVVDVGLPDMSGDAVVRELAGIAPQLPVIIATGYGTAELEGEFGGAARIRLMGKPYDGATLRRALQGLGFDIAEE